MTADTTARDIAAAHGLVETDPEWPIVSTDRVPLAQFGKDHWSTFAYVETRGVDYRGFLDHDHMRCDTDRHPILRGAKRLGSRLGASLDRKYPTRLRNRIERADHDDYDCLDDLVAAGLLTVQMPTRREDGRFVDASGKVVPEVGPSDLLTGLTEQMLSARARWTLTADGVRVASLLRQFKVEGGTFAQFTEQVEEMLS